MAKGNILSKLMDPATTITGKNVLDGIGAGVKKGKQMATKEGLAALKQSTKMPSGKEVLGKALFSDVRKIDGENRRLSNLYTGKKLNGKLIGGVAAGAGLMAVGGPSGLTGSQAATPDKMSDIQNIFDLNGIMATKSDGTVEQGMNASLAADGTSGVAQTTNAPTLGASGQMVFGMHNTRKGR